MTDESSAFPVNTRPTKAVVVSSLIKDATIEACLFDLIDNSIDAAKHRNECVSPGSGPEDGPLGDYGDVRIELELGEDGVEIVDNCTGMTVSELRRSNLRFGAASGGSFSIGAFGVGLNRALFKLGGRTLLETDNGNEAARLEFDHSKYLSTEDWELPAMSRSSSGKTGTMIVISDPSPEVFTQLSRTEFVERLSEALGLRYQQFLARGLTIILNGMPISAKVIEIRESGPISPMQASFKASDGVNVELYGGQHVRHRFTSEDGYDRKLQRELTPEYGWNVFCNGRLILASDKSPKTGWTNAWHPEYNGFVGTVAFVSEAPRLLPWNTTKTDIVETTQCFSEALEKMGEITAVWRQQWRKAKVPPKSTDEEDGRSRGSGIAGPISRGVRGGPTDLKSDDGSNRNGQQPSRKEPTPTDSDKLLPEGLGGADVKGKLNSLLNEATLIRVSESPHLSMAALRMLAESACIELLKKKKFLGECARLEQTPGGNKADGGRAKGRTVPRFDTMLRFVRDRPASFFGDHSPYLMRSLDSLIREKKEMNEVVHNPFHRLSVQRAIHIRDAVQPVIEGMLEAIRA